MRKKLNLLFNLKVVIAIGLMSTHLCPASIVVSVDCDINAVTRSEPLRFGICLNHQMDSDRVNPGRKYQLRESLKALNVKAIRWNEGDLGDHMIWSIPPYKKPDAHATHMNMPMSSKYKLLVDDHGKLQGVMELDEAIAVARDLDIELYIIIGIDAIWSEDPSVRGQSSDGRTTKSKLLKGMTDYAWATDGKTARQMIVDATEALAQYLADEASDLTVFLEIGNECYLGSKMGWKPARYAELVNELSGTIKTANPRLKVGAQLDYQNSWTCESEDGRSWGDVMLEELEFRDLDHIVVHQYGYKTLNPLDCGVEFLEQLPKQDRERIELTVTELGSRNTPEYTGGWGPNNLRQALYMFRWMGLNQLHGKGLVRTPIVWTTRWMSQLRDGPYKAPFHALDIDGALTANGMAISLWNTYVHDSLVEVKSSDKTLYCYASQSSLDPPNLTVWLANNHDQKRRVALELHNYQGNALRSVHIFSGNGPEDLHPQLKRVKKLPASRDNKTVDLNLPPYSIVMLQYK